MYLHVLICKVNRLIYLNPSQSCAIPYPVLVVKDVEEGVF